MAIWQLGFYLIPIETITDKLPFKQFLDESLLEWKSKRIDRNSQKKLSNHLPMEKSWSNTILQYGNIESTCIEIATDIVTIRVRLDLARITREVYESVLDFITANNCALYKLNTGECYQGNRSGLFQLIFDSKLFTIMRKNNKFLEELYVENVT